MRCPDKRQTARRNVELGSYDANKRGYTLYPFEEGIKYDDFSVVISEKELKNNYLIEVIRPSCYAA